MTQRDAILTILEALALSIAEEEPEIAEALREIARRFSPMVTLH